MNAEEINRWLSENIHNPTVQIDTLDLDELLELLASIRNVETELKAFEQRTLTTRVDRVLGTIGVVSGFAGVLALLTPFAFLGVPLTAGGAVLSGYQLVRDRQKALDGEWCDARFSDLVRCPNGQQGPTTGECWSAASAYSPLSRLSFAQ